MAVEESVGESSTPRSHGIYGSCKIAKRDPEPNTNGHRGLPAEGDTIRVYLSRNAYDGFGTTEDGRVT